MKPSPFTPQSFPILPPVKGCTISTIAAGIRYNGRDDMALLSFTENTHIAGVYTRSLTAAAPVNWCRQACGDGRARAILINAGNANAFTGAQGKKDTAAMAQHCADALSCTASDIMICSTGIIGEFLPMDVITRAIPTLASSAHPDGWRQCADAIMTTDTFAKVATRSAKIGDVAVTINGVAKGSGMIAPDMATMLGFIVTDANIPANILQSLLSRYTRTSFNAITVDSDTSTNDTVLCAATGHAGNAVPTGRSDAMLADFNAALESLMQELAIAIVKDGEGATKFVTVTVTGAKDNSSAHTIGRAVADSPLVKTALAASDPNWGRIVAAIGKSGEWIDPDALSISLGDIPVTADGCVHENYSEARATAYMQQPELTINIDCGIAGGQATIWTCDLTHGYISINADYRS